MRVWASAAIVLCACTNSNSGAPSDGDSGGAPGCSVTISGDLTASNLKCTTGVNAFGMGDEQAELSVAANKTQPITMSFVCTEPAPLVPGTYGDVSMNLGCTAVLSDIAPDGGVGYDFLPRPTMGATVKVQLDSIRPLHGAAKGTLIESYFDGGTGRTVIFVATF